ncbi:MAG: ABC transporter ATP-binding protein [Burkholderiaceae bacterium]|nr:ABC transporter ATP-binding protein [Burkholderiaceae bacterium]
MLKLEGVAHAYGERQVLVDVAFALLPGEIGCLLGPSGCGKTTALRLIAGFESLQSGRIRIAGEEVAGPGHSVPPQRRQVGLVFQDYALFPHLSVAENVGFGLGHLSRSDRRRRVDEMLALTGLQHEARLAPARLSGGQQQRVALARALAPRPRLLLMDEPFSNLDVELRERLSLEVRDILKHEGITALLVTHDQQEAFALSDRIGIVNDGLIQQWGEAYALYHEPANRFVADFVGQGAFLPGTVVGAGEIGIELGVLRGEAARDGAAGSCFSHPIGTRVDVLIRPDDIVHDDTSPIQAEVVRKSFRGADFLYTLALESGARVLALVPSDHDHAMGESIGIRLEVDHVVAFDADDHP